MPPAAQGHAQAGKVCYNKKVCVESGRAGGRSHVCGICQVCGHGGAVPLCAEYLDGVKMLDLTNALVVGVILAAIYTVLRPVMRLILSVLNFCTLGLLYIAVDAWLVWTAAGLVENSVVFDSYWWALAVAVIINVARTLVDAAGGDLKR